MYRERVELSYFIKHIYFRSPVTLWLFMAQPSKILMVCMGHKSHHCWHQYFRFRNPLIQQPKTNYFETMALRSAYID